MIKRPVRPRFSTDANRATHHCRLFPISAATAAFATFT
jgi:hypothetical protein